MNARQILNAWPKPACQVCGGDKPSLFIWFDTKAQEYVCGRCIGWAMLNGVKAMIDL